MASTDDVCSVLEGFSQISVEPPVETRTVCNRCGRPESVCWCKFIPDEPFDVTSTVIILQHPGEERRCLRTAPMLQQGLPEGKCFTYKGRRFNHARHSDLESQLNSKNTLILYPGEDATSITELPTVSQRGEGYRLVALDGTWAQAKSIYHQSEMLHKLQQVRLETTQVSQYVIRTQPTNSCVSTVEAVAVALSVLEGKPKIVERLLRPLRALCDFQLKHGAVEHQSSEFLISNGIYKDQPVPKRTKKKLRRSGLVLSPPT